MIGQEVGNWVLEAAIASGGMGDVYRARHKTLNTQAAVKVLRPHISDADEMQQRFGREAAIQAKLQHPHVARVLDYHLQDGRWYLVIEFLDHGSVADKIRQADGPIPIPQALAWVRQALDGLHYAHGQGIVHRDVKPDNLLLDAYGQVKVTDFGIARDLTLTRLTSTGMTLGTPHYMSPEQLLAPDQVDERSDVYAMGVVLYELLAGEPPFSGSSFFEVSQAQIQKTPPPLAERNPAVPAELAAIVSKAMGKSPAERFASCHDFGRAIELFEAQKTPGMPSPLPLSTMLGQNDRTHRMSSAEIQSLAPAPRRRTSWRRMAANLGLGVLAVGLAFLLWQLLDFNQAHADPIVSELLEQAQKAEIAAAIAEKAREQAGEVAEQAEDEAHKVTESTPFEDAAKTLAGAEVALEQARKASQKAEEQAKIAEEALQVAEAQAKKGQIDTTKRPEGEVGLVPVVPNAGTAEAIEAAQDAVEVVRRAHERARDHATNAASLIRQAEDVVERAKNILGGAQDRERDRIAKERERFEREAKENMENEVAKLRKQQEDKLKELGITGPGSSEFPLGPLPEHPVVAVLATGDPVMAVSFEEELERRLRRAQLDIRDEHNSAEVSRMLRSPIAPEATALTPELVRSGFHVLVLISVQEGERRHLELFKQRGNAVGARLRVNAYLLLNGRAIGRGWSELIEYTEMSAQAKAKRAMLRETAELVTSIRDTWKQVRTP